MKKTQFIIVATTVFLFMMVASCGGGGGGTPTAQATNTWDSAKWDTVTWGP